MSKTFILIATLLITLSCTASDQKDQKSEKSEKIAPQKIEKKEVKKVKEVKKEVKKQEITIISQEETKKLIEKGVALIDNRPARKFNAGHIKGAINLPFYKAGDPTNVMTRENLIKAIGKKSNVVFYCTGFIRAENASKIAIKWNIKQKIYWYKDGYRDWSQNR